MTGTNTGDHGWVRTWGAAPRAPGAAVAAPDPFADAVHGSDAGYRALAGSIDLSLFDGEL